MAKLTLDDLRRIRETKQRELDRRSPDNKTIQIIVGMGTSGIAAGAKLTLAAFVDAVDQFGVEGVTIRQTGSIGLDHAEPVVEVRSPGMPPTIYGRVTAAVAEQIVKQHLIEGRLVDDHVYDRPAADIIDVQPKG